VDEAVLGKVTVSTGNLAGGRWTLPAATHGAAILEGKLTLAPKVWRPKPSTFNYRKQPLVVEPAEATMPDGYRTETYQSPRDNYGREQLFEPLGMVVAPDGTIVVSTRTAGIWQLRGHEWTLLAEGLFDSLGVQVEDEHGNRVVAGQKAELTRITDTNGDGLADSFETLMDEFEYTGNYQAYMHGPVPDGNGGYFVTLNLNDSGGNDYEYRAGGRYMGTSGGYRGWAIHVPAKGGFEPWADGLRSPAGLGVGPDGRVWYADNQGEYVGTSKLFLLEKGGFYGHPAGLVDRPGMIPSSPEISWNRVKEHRENAVVLFPQNRLANSPGNPVWDTTGGKFGPFAGQMFIGDQTQSDLIRVTTEKVGSHEQGVAIPFATNLQSGLMRPVFLPDGSLLIGQTGRGWQAKGGHVSSLQRIVWDGKTTPLAIQDVKAIPGGFEVQLTMPVPTDMDVKKIGDVVAVKSWVYRDAPDYGSPELDEHAEPVASVSVSGDRRSLKVLLGSTVQPKIHPEQTARVHHLGVDGKTLWGAAGRPLEAYYSLYEFPETR
jgi:glucose/arabinose dehydrogenase